MHRKEDLYQKVVALRYKGFSYNEILRCVPVGNGTISRWCHGISLTKEQKRRLIEKRRNNSYIRHLRKQATQSKKEAKIWAREQIRKLSSSDQLLLISGLLLYWAEGTSQPKSLQFTNTNPQIVKLMMKFFRKILKVSEKKFRIMVRIGDEGNIERAKRYWLRTTGLSKRNLRRPEILKLVANSKSLRKHPYGICRIEIHDISLARKLTTLIKEFSKKFLSPRSSVD